MSKSEKRKAHDRAKAEERAKQVMETMRKSREAVERSERCNCENSECEEAGRHIVGACGVRATDPSLRIADLGRLCRGCFATYPEMYRESVVKEHDRVARASHRF